MEGHLKHIDQLSGMITREQAEALSKDENEKAELDVKRILSLSSPTGQIHNLSVSDSIYRIFNQTVRHGAKRSQKHRLMVMGAEGCAVKLILNGKISEEVDRQGIIHGDSIRITNLIFDMDSQTLYSTVFSELRLNERALPDPYNENLFEGSITEIIRGSGGERLSTAAELRALGKNGIEAEILLSGSSAEAASSASKGDRIIIEFFGGRPSEAGKWIFGNSDSRVLILPGNTSFRSRSTPSVPRQL